MGTPFDLDKAVAAWRRPYEHDRTFGREDLDELEGHLRDRTEALVASGVPEAEAFAEALRRMGPYGVVEAEYRKVYWRKLKRQRRLSSELIWSLTMLKNYVKTACRNLLRQKGYSTLNVAGLAAGMACCLLLFQYVTFEYSFDTFNANGPDLYRVNLTTARPGEAPQTVPLTAYATGPALAEAVPEVVGFARLHPDYGGPVVSNPVHPDKVFEEEHVYYADPSFLRLFTYPLLAGDSARALAEPGTVLVSRSAARKYFGDEQPLGQVLHVSGWVQGPFRVTGVFEDVPANSHLRFDLLLPLADLLSREDYSGPETAWAKNNFNTYVRLREGADRAEVERKFTAILMAHRGEVFRERKMTASMGAQPLRDVYLNGDIFAPYSVAGSYRTVYFFSLIGLVTLVIALVNYVNLATARALGRAREVGVRKVVGAKRSQLVVQFLLESAITNLLAAALALGLAAGLRPLLNGLAGVHLPGMTSTPWFGAALATVIGAGTLLAGLYPAFVLSSFRPVSVLKGKAGSGEARLWLRRGLVVLQFGAAVVLVAGTAIVHDQLGYMRGMDLGMDLEQVLTVQGPRVLPEEIDQAAAVGTLTRELRGVPGVRQVATSSTLPGQGFNWYTSGVRRADADPSASVSGVLTWIDSSFARLYGLDLVAGEGFRGVTAAPPEGEPMLVVANESAVRAVGFESAAAAVGQIVLVAGTEARIVGVFRDFNWSSAHAARENAFFAFSTGSSEISLKVGTEGLPRTLAAVERIYTTLFPGNPFRYAFLEEAFDEQYRNDRRFAALFTIFSALAVGIACLGLFGLASFATQQRTKEVGIRKVLGASVGSIMVLLSRDFLGLVGVAVLVGSPVAYLMMSRWLEGFAYRIEVGPGVFVLAGAIALVIALVTVSYQAARAALSNPAKSLRYE